MTDRERLLVELLRLRADGGLSVREGVRGDEVSIYTTKEDQMGINAGVETITPDIAKEILMGNHSNRRVKRAKVEQYASDMVAGNWRLNGESVILNGDGTLYSGQHRLLACVEAGVPFQTVVVRGVPSEAVMTIDTGVARTLADYLTIKGNPNASILASVVIWSMRYDTMIDKGTNQLGGSSFSRSEQVSYLSVPRHEWALQHTMDVITEAKALLIGKPSLYGFAHFIASRDSGLPQGMIDSFITYSCDPAGLAPTQAPALLRSALLSLQAKSAHRRPSTTVEAALIAKAMGFWVRDTQGKILKWGRGRERGKGEPFPRIVQ